MINTIKNLIKQQNANGELILSETLINNTLKQAGQNCTAKLLHSNNLSFCANQVSAQLAYGSYNPHTQSLSFKIVDLKPSHYKLMLGMIHKKFPFLSYAKANGNKIITCHLNKIDKRNEFANNKITDIQFINNNIHIKFDPA